MWKSKFWYFTRTEWKVWRCLPRLKKTMEKLTVLNPTFKEIVSRWAITNLWFKVITKPKGLLEVLLLLLSIPSLHCNFKNQYFFINQIQTTLLGSLLVIYWIWKRKTNFMNQLFSDHWPKSFNGNRWKQAIPLFKRPYQGEIYNELIKEVFSKANNSKHIYSNYRSLGFPHM